MGDDQGGELGRLSRPAAQQPKMLLKKQSSSSKPGVGGGMRMMRCCVSTAATKTKSEAGDLQAPLMADVAEEVAPTTKQLLVMEETSTKEIPVMEATEQAEANARAEADADEIAEPPAAAPHSSGEVVDASALTSSPDALHELVNVGEDTIAEEAAAAAAVAAALLDRPADQPAAAERVFVPPEEDDDGPSTPPPPAARFAPPPRVDEATGLLEGVKKNRLTDKAKKETEEDEDEGQGDAEPVSKRVKKVAVPFHRRPCATTKGMIILWTTMSVLLVSVVCGALFKWATPLPTTVVGPNGETWLEETSSEPSPELAMSTSTARDDVAAVGGDGDEDEDDRASASSPSSKRSAGEKAASASSGAGSGGALRRKVAAGKTKEAVASLGRLSDGGAPVTEEAVDNRCLPKPTEKIHGVYRQFHAACERREEGVPGCIPETPCQKCYLKGSPAQTQAKSMGWCRAAVCAQFSVDGCKGGKNDPLLGVNEDADDSGENRGRGYKGGTPRANGQKRRRKEFDDGKEGWDGEGKHVEEEEGAEEEEEEVEAERVHRGYTPSEQSEEEREGVHRGYATGKPSEEARRGSGGRRAGPNERLSDNAGPRRRVGACLPALGDAKRGRFQYDDPACLLGGGVDSGADSDGAGTMGCVSAGNSSCRFCLTRVRADSTEEEEAGEEDVYFVTCPRDVCKVHDLRWNQCDPARPLPQK